MKVATPDPVGLVDYLSRSLVKYPDSVEIIPVKGPSSLVIELRVHPDDLGAIIGRGGRIVRSFRTLLNSIAVKRVTVEDGTTENYSKVLLEIVDE